MSQNLASLSFDLDDRWTYLRTHGDAEWESYPSYFDILVPRVLDLLAERDLRITFFIVGQDAALPEKRQALASLVAAGHEIGNHSFHHEQWLHLFSEQEIEHDLERAEGAIEDATGLRPRGFRGPGYSLSAATLRVLARRGYHYDASTLPTYLGPLARAYYFRTAKLSTEERRQRERLFGTFAEGLRPVGPYLWTLDDGSLLEIPVTTMPILKLPFHLSYLLYIGTYSHTLAKLYLRLALGLCRLTGTQPSLLLHPLDFLGVDDGIGLGFFPGMSLPTEVKLFRAAELIDIYRRRLDVLPLGRHAEAIRRRGQLAQRRPDFSPASAVSMPGAR